MKVVLSTYDPEKHDVDGFVFNGWSPEKVVIVKGKTAAVVVKTPKSLLQWGSTNFRGIELTGKIRGPVYIVRVRTKTATTIIAYPDTLDEARQSLTAHFA